MSLRSVGCWALALLLVLSCGKESGIGQEEEILRAEAPQVEPVTRVEIGATGSFTWSADDKIAVHYSTPSPEYSDYRTATLLSGAGDAVASFKVMPNGTRDGYALYPAAIADSSYPGLSGGPLRVNLPQRYLLSASSMGLWAPMPMLADNTATNLSFRHLGALMRLTLTDVPAGTCELSISSDRALAGSFVVRDLSGVPGISADDQEYAGEYNTVLYTLPSASAGGSLVLNIPFPAGVHSNLTIVALDDTDTEIGVINAGVERVLGRGEMRQETLSFTGSGRLARFTADPLNLTLTTTQTLSYSIVQLKADGGVEPAYGYTLTLDAVSDPDIVRVSIDGNVVSVSGIMPGTVQVRLQAAKGDDVVFATSIVTVQEPVTQIFSTGSVLYQNHSMNLKAMVTVGGTDIAANAELKYSWSITSGGALATLTSDGPSALLKAGDSVGTVTVLCQIYSSDPEGIGSAMEVEKAFTIQELVPGTTGALFSVSRTERVLYAKANAYKLKSDGLYYLFDRQWDAYNGVVTDEAPDLAAKMDCVDPQYVVSKFGNAASSEHIWAGSIETSGWRLLTYDQAYYLLNQRAASPVGTTDNARYVVATVGGHHGLILFPDEFTWPKEMELPQQINSIKKGDESWIRYDFPNKYTITEWEDYLEPLGAVFLPGWKDAPCYRSLDRYNSSPSNRRRDDTATVGRPWNSYTLWYFCYYIYDSYMQIPRTMNYTLVTVTTPQYMPIDYNRYFHLRPVKDVE